MLDLSGDKVLRDEVMRELIEDMRKQLRYVASLNEAPYLTPQGHGRDGKPLRLTLKQRRAHADICSCHEYRRRWGVWPSRGDTISLGGKRRAVTAIAMMEGP